MQFIVINLNRTDKLKQRQISLLYRLAPITIVTVDIQKYTIFNFFLIYLSGNSFKSRQGLINFVTSLHWNFNSWPYLGNNKHFYLKESIKCCYHFSNILYSGFLYYSKQKSLVWGFFIGQILQLKNFEGNLALLIN